MRVAEGPFAFRRFYLFPFPFVCPRLSPNGNLLPFADAFPGHFVCVSTGPTPCKDPLGRPGMICVRSFRYTLLVAVLFVGLPATRSAAADRFCDPSFQDCRAPLLTLIANERVGIDLGFWFMEDARYTAAVIKRFQAGVPVRVLVDPRANVKNPQNASRLAELAAAGIPMRKCIASGILHWKAMIFDGQNTVEFGGANYSAWAFVPVQPYVNYTDEVIHFTDNSSIVQSFMTKFDDLWTNDQLFDDFANMSGAPVRMHPIAPKDPSLNFPPTNDYASRAVKLYNAETSRIDALMFRVTDRRHADAMIAAAGRGLIVRLLTEQEEDRKSVV